MREGAAFLRAYHPEKLAGQPGSSIEDKFLSLLEGELKSARGQLPWLLGVAFCAGLLLGFILGQLR